MSTELRIPKIGMSMDEAILSAWLVADGAEVAEGVPIYSVETDKSTVEIEAPASGRLSIVGVEGETYPVGELVGRID